MDAPGGGDKDIRILDAELVDHLPDACTGGLNPAHTWRERHTGGKVEKNIGALQAFKPGMLLFGSPREWTAVMIGDVAERRLQIGAIQNFDVIGFGGAYALYVFRLQR